MESFSMQFSETGFFYLAYLRFIDGVVCISSSFLSLQNGVPLYECTRVCLLIHTLKDV